MALKHLMKLALEKSLSHLRAFGDSKLFISWMNNQLQIHNIHLLPLVNQFKDKRDYFDHITFPHVFLELNILANELSMLGLLLPID